MIVPRSTVLSLSVLIGVINVASGFVVPAFGWKASCSPTKLSSFLSRKSYYGRGRLAKDHSSKKTMVRGRRELLRATIPNDLDGKERLDKFLADCELMGPVHFACMTEASMLEAVGSFDNLRYDDLPSGRYATVSEGKDFKCHLNTDKIKSIQMVIQRSADDDHDVYITRFRDDKGEIVLSAMLHGEDGAYEPGATDYWKKMRKSFGAEQTIV